MPRKKNNKNKQRQNRNFFKVNNANQALSNVPEHRSLFCIKTCMLCIIYESFSVAPSITKDAQILVKWINHINQGPRTRSQNQAIIRQKQKIESDRLLWLFLKIGEDQQLKIKTSNQPIQHIAKQRENTLNAKVNKSFFIIQQDNRQANKKSINPQYEKILNFYLKKTVKLQQKTHINETIQSPIEETNSNEQTNLEKSQNLEKEIQQQDFSAMSFHGSQQRKLIEADIQKQQINEIQKQPDKQERLKVWNKYQRLLSQKKLKFSQTILQRQRLH